MADSGPQRLANIRGALQAFATKPLKEAALGLFTALGYSSEKTVDLGSKPTDFLASIEPFRPESGAVNRDKVRANDWNKCHFLFQLTNDEIPALA